MDLIDQLQSENEALKSELERLKVEKEHLEKLNAWYIEKLKIRNEEKFGKSSEKSNSDQISFFDLFNEAETLQEPIVTEPTEEILVPTHRRKKSKRGSNFAKLRVEVIEYKLEDEEKVCDMCGNELVEMKKEIRKELKVIPAESIIVEHVTYVYSCRSCDKEGIEGFIKNAKSPKALIPKSMVSPSVMAYTINQKFTNAMPLYRQEQEWKRLGVELTRQNLSNWMLKAANLLKPLEMSLKLELLRNDVLHADETTLDVLYEPGKESTSKSYMWLYRTSHDTEKPVILYDYQIGRSGIYAEKFLEQWHGKYLHCDGYGGYKRLIDKILCGCFAHAKRKFLKASKANPEMNDSRVGEAYIQKLFSIESKANKLELDTTERLILRQNESKQVLDEFYNWIEEISTKTLPKSLLGEAITYAVNQKEYLYNFLLDGRVQLTNNLAEQAIKMFVIGRKNWLFSNTANGAKSSSTLYSIIQTAIANKLKPLYYLQYVFEQIQNQQNLNVHDILPWSENLPDKCKNNKHTN